MLLSIGFEKRQALRRRGIRPQLLKRLWKGKKKPGRPIKISVPRFQQERISACFCAFVAIATIHLWINRILLVG